MRAILRYLKAALVSCVSVVAVVVPVYLFVSSNLPEDPPRLHTPVALAVGQSGPRVLSIPAYTGSVPVLSYREVSDRPKALSPTRFAAQMQRLADERFHPVTISQLGAFLRSGRSLPERPIVISFDQPLGSLWREVDPILESHNFRATAFMAPATVGHHLPYNLSSLELKKMVASERWDIEAALAYLPDQRLGADRLDQLLASFERRQLPPAPCLPVSTRGDRLERRPPAVPAELSGRCRSALHQPRRYAVPAPTAVRRPSYRHAGHAGRTDRGCQPTPTERLERARLGA